MDMKRFFLYAIAIAALALAGCGGGGGTGPIVDNGNGNGGGTCPAGTMDNYPDCTPIAPPPAACTLGGAALECKAAVVAQPIADADTVTMGFDTGLDIGRPNAEIDNNGEPVATGGERPLMVDGGKVSPNADATAANQGKFTMSMDMTPATVTGYTESIHTRTMDATDDDPMVHDMVTLYTNQQAATAQDYEDYFAETNLADSDHSATKALNNTAHEDFDDDGTLSIAIDDITGNGGLFAAPAFPSGISQTFTFRADDEDTPVDETTQPGMGPKKFDGTFRAVSGEYECTADTCTAMSGTDGKLALLTGSWTFTPDDNDVKVAGVIPDMDYMSFGYWVQATTEDDETTYGISTFASGTAFPIQATEGSTAISALVGSATYNGSATGLYVKKSFSTDVNDFVVSNSGQFTADAQLMAYFGGDNIGIANKHSIHGTVSNFNDADGNPIDSMWTVTLKGLTMDAATFDGGEGNTGSTYTNIFNGATSTGMGSSPGAWRGGFYGVPVGADGTPMANVDTTPHDDSAPTGVAGEFNAHFSPGGGQSPGHAIGAFGARR